MLTKAHWNEMRRHVSGEAPLEACGLVAAIGGKSVHVYEIRNEAQSAMRYRMAAKEQLDALLDMDARGWKMLAIYHSHPNGPAEPSETDLREAAYPEAVQLIWSISKGPWACQGFQFHDGDAFEIAIKLISDE